MITEPKWKNWVVETNGIIFTPKLCQEIINISKTIKKEKGKINNLDDKLNTIRKSTINWIPFNKMQSVYDDI